MTWHQRGVELEVWKSSTIVLSLIFMCVNSSADVCGVVKNTNISTRGEAFYVNHVCVFVLRVCVS